MPPILALTPDIYHRQLLDIYRLPIYLRTGANANISCIWLTVKKLLEGGVISMDKTLFLQVDGGSENANQTLLQFMAMLCQKKFFSRVGRTSRHDSHSETIFA